MMFWSELVLRFFDGFMKRSKKNGGKNVIQNQSNTSAVSKSTLDPKFVITIEGKDFVTYTGLLHAAHQSGLVKVETEILQYPSAENDNTAVVRAVAEGK